MELFTSQGLRSEISLTDSHEGPDHQNFIRFLQMAISANVGFLPLTWDPAFEALGRGATGEVNQSRLNSKTWIAFKRFKTDGAHPGLLEDEFRNIQYNAMISELNVLGHPNIRNHPNIISLIGACFEINPVSNEVLPVLALAKAHHADLTMSLYEIPRLIGIPKDVFPPLPICGEVAKGIKMLHQCGTII
jgi:hypothetical protein